MKDFFQVVFIFLIILVTFAVASIIFGAIVLVIVWLSQLILVGLAAGKLIYAGLILPLLALLFFAGRIIGWTADEILDD